jgi:IS30 family transposase
LDENPKLKLFVEDGLNQKWSPEEISIRLALKYKDDPSMQLSHETIYRALYIQSRGTLKKELQKQLRRKNPYRKSRRLKKSHDGRGQIPDLVSISERPPEVEDRAVPGHWEGDLLLGKNNVV